MFPNDVISYRFVLKIYHLGERDYGLQMSATESVQLLKMNRCNRSGAFNRNLGCVSEAYPPHALQMFN